MLTVTPLGGKRIPLAAIYLYRQNNINLWWICCIYLRKPYLGVSRGWPTLLNVIIGKPKKTRLSKAVSNSSGSFNSRLASVFILQGRPASSRSVNSQFTRGIGGHSSESFIFKNTPFRKNRYAWRSCSNARRSVCAFIYRKCIGWTVLRSLYSFTSTQIV